MTEEKKGKENKSEAIVPAKRKLDAEIVLYSGNAEVSKELEKAQTLHPTDFYQVAGKTVPSARALQWLANRKNIKTKIIDIQSTRDYCRAIVAGWIGDNPTPTANKIYKEATVEMMFDVEIAGKIIDLISKNNLAKDKDYGVDKETGTPFLLNPRYIEKQMKELLSLRKFALRTVVTKAERIIHSKLADVEWREEDEMLDEKSEVEMVSGKNIDNTPTPLEIKPAPAKPEIKDAEEVEKKEELKPLPTKFNLPSDLLKECKTARQAYAEIFEWGMQSEIMDEIRPIVLEAFPEYRIGEMDILNIPETALIQIVETISGLKFKKCEKVLKCECGAKMTEPEKEEQGSCLSCYKKKQE